MITTGDHVKSSISNQISKLESPSSHRSLTWNDEERYFYIIFFPNIFEFAHPMFGKPNSFFINEMKSFIASISTQTKFLLDYFCPLPNSLN